MVIRLLRCKNSQGWLPDDYLTSIVGNCDRGQFVITQEMRVPASLTPDGSLFQESTVERLIPATEVKLERVRCQRCGGKVEWVEVDPELILSQIRDHEVDEKRRSKTSQRMRDAEQAAAEAETAATEVAKEIAEATGQGPDHKYPTAIFERDELDGDSPAAE